MDDPRVRDTDDFGSKPEDCFIPDAKPPGSGKPPIETLFDLPQDGGRLAAVARELLRCRRAADVTEKALKRANESARRAEADMLRLMDECGVLSVKVATGETLSAQTATYYRLPAGVIDANQSVRDWLLAQGGLDLVKHTVHPSSLSGFCRELADRGVAVHDAVKRVEIRSVKVKKG